MAIDSSLHRFIAEGVYSPSWGKDPIELEFDRRWKWWCVCLPQRTL